MATTPRRLRLTNLEVETSYDRMVQSWFADAEDELVGQVRLGDDLVVVILNYVEQR